MDMESCARIIATWMDSMMKPFILCIVFLILLTTPCLALDNSQWLLIGGTASDYFSVQGWHGGRELNPAMPNRTSQAVVMSVTSGIAFATSYALKKHGHPKAARVLNYIVGGAHFGAAVWNVKERCKY
jgi:hypothetical protein